MNITYILQPVYNLYFDNIHWAYTSRVIDGNNYK